jgi:hypothetical protein
MQSCAIKQASGIDMLNDSSGSYELSRSIRQLRSDFQRDLRSDSQNTHLTAKLALFGDLTKPAKDKFRSLQKQYGKAGVSLQLVTWRDSCQKLHFADSEPVDLQINLGVDDTEKGLLRHNDYCYLLAHAASFYDAFRKYEWSLFEWNVRLNFGARNQRRFSISQPRAKHCQRKWLTSMIVLSA